MKRHHHKPKWHYGHLSKEAAKRNGVPVQPVKWRISLKSDAVACCVYSIDDVFLAGVASIDATGLIES